MHKGAAPLNLLHIQNAGNNIPIFFMRVCVQHYLYAVHIAWQSPLYGLQYWTQGARPQGEGLYKAYSMRVLSVRCVFIASSNSWHVSRS